MKVQELMSADVAIALAKTDLSRAARQMLNHDCGVLPVVDAEGHVTGMITDRDICRAVTTKARPPSRISVEEVESRRVYSASPDDDLETALETMKTHQVRRLPVIDAGGHLKGILSMNDVVLHADEPGAASSTTIVNALKGICTHKHVEAA